MATNTATRAQAQPQRMTSAGRVLLVIVIGATLFTFASVGLAAAAIYRGGSIEVNVEGRRGDNFALHVPAGLANVALMMVPDSVIDEAVDEIARELDVEPQLHELRNGWRQLVDAPDFTLVEVEGHRESVRVQKERGRLVVRVDGGNDEVFVAIPLKTVERLLAKF